MTNYKPFISFLVSPVLGIIEAFKDLRNKHSRIIIFWFCLCFGICFSVDTVRTKGSADGISMRIEFEDAKSLSDEQYSEYLKDYFDFDTGAQDIYIVTVSYLVGKITDNYHFFFLFLAFVFAFFQLKCLRYFVKEINFTNSAICVILACLFLWNNIYNINGARFWTASWIGLYCIFKIFYEGKRRYIILSFMLFMIHASFAIFPVIVVLSLVIKNQNKLLLIIFCISWAFSIVADDYRLESFSNAIDMPLSVARKVDAYTSMETLQGTGYYWVALIFKILSRHYIDFLILLILINRKKVKHERSNSIIGVMALVAIIANFGLVIPTFGGRFFEVNYALVAYSFLTLFGDKKYSLFIYLLPLVWFMKLFYLSKDVMEVLDFGFLLSPLFSFARYTFI